MIPFLVQCLCAPFCEIRIILRVYFYFHATSKIKLQPLAVTHYPVLNRILRFLTYGCQMEYLAFHQRHPSSIMLSDLCRLHG